MAHLMYISQIMFIYFYTAAEVLLRCRSHGGSVVWKLKKLLFFSVLSYVLSAFKISRIVSVPSDIVLTASIV